MAITYFAPVPVFTFVDAKGRRYQGTTISYRSHFPLVLMGNSFPLMEGDFESDGQPPRRFSVGELTVFDQNGNTLRFNSPVIVRNVERIVSFSNLSRCRAICHFTNDRQVILQPGATRYRQQQYIRFFNQMRGRLGREFGVPAYVAGPDVAIGTPIPYALYPEADFTPMFLAKEKVPTPEEEITADALRELLGSAGDGAAEVRFNAEGGIRP